MKKIKIYGDIGWDVTAQAVKEELTSLSGDISLHINSAGGSLADGLDIYNLIKAYQAKKGKVTAYLENFVASSATLIASACQEVVASPRTLYMIHQVSGGSFGNADDLRSTADAIDIRNQHIADIYAAKSGQTSQKFSDILNQKRDNWMSPEEALELGLVNKIEEFDIGLEQPLNSDITDVHQHYMQNFYQQDLERFKNMGDTQRQIENKASAEKAEPKVEVVEATTEAAMQNKAPAPVVVTQNKPIPATELRNKQEIVNKKQLIAEAFAHKYGFINKVSDNNPYAKDGLGALETIAKAANVTLRGKNEAEVFINAISTDAFKEYYDAAVQHSLGEILTPLFNNLSSFVQFRPTRDYRKQEYHFRYGITEDYAVVEGEEPPTGKLQFKNLLIKPEKRGLTLPVTEEAAQAEPYLLRMTQGNLFDSLAHGISKLLAKTLESTPTNFFKENTNFLKSAKIDADSFDNLIKLTKKVVDKQGNLVLPNITQILVPPVLEDAVRLVTEARFDPRVGNDGSPNLHNRYQITVLSGLKPNAIYFVERGNIVAVSVHNRIFADGTHNNNGIPIETSAIVDKKRGVVEFVGKYGAAFDVIDKNRIFKLELTTTTSSS